MAVKAPVTFPVGTFRASAKIVHERKDPEDGGVQKESHELFTEVCVFFFLVPLVYVLGSSSIPSMRMDHIVCMDILPFQRRERL